MGSCSISCRAICRRRSASLVDLKAYIEKYTPKTKEPKSVNWWGNRGKYITSYLKAIYGDKATKENDFGYAWLPKLDEGMNASWLMLFDQMHRGKFEGFFAWGQNPACSGANANKIRQALAKLKWMVNVNLFDNETGSFWKGPGMNPKDIQTEVFMLPCCLVRGKGRQHLELRPVGPVAIQGHRSDRPVKARRGDHERALLQGEELLPEGRRQVPGADHEPHLELWGKGR